MRDAFESDRQSASGPHPSHACVTMKINWMTAEELNEAIRSTCSAFTAKGRLRQRARTA
jgi:hypothetical protein